MATLNSLFLISLGTPMIIPHPFRYRSLYSSAALRY